MRMDAQTPKIKYNKENNHTKDSSFEFNLNQSIDCEVYSQGKILMMDNCFPSKFSPKGS